MKTYKPIIAWVLACGLAICAGQTLARAQGAGFTYQDTDLLLVFRKDGASDVLFNLGTVSNFLGQANGAVSSVPGVNVDLLHDVFGVNLTGVKYALAATTPVYTDGTPLRAWLSDSDPNGNPRDETFSRWSTQRGKITAIGTAATSYPNSSNQSLVLPANDPGSYSFIAGDGGLQDTATFGGTSPFPVESDNPGNLRLIELRISTANPKPFSTQVGNFALAADGSLTFTAGILPPTIVTAPASQAVECGGSLGLTVAASGVNPLAYQWQKDGNDLTGETGSSFSLSPAFFGVAGDYRVIVSNSGGSVTSSVAIVTVADTTGPVLSLPGDITANRNRDGGAVVNFSATGNDACAGSVIVTCTPSSGSLFPMGQTSVACSANDGHGNTSSGGFTVTVQDVLLVVSNNVYAAFRTDLTNGAWVYVDADIQAASVVRATQRALGYREVDYKSQVPGTLYFSQVTPTTNAGTITYDYSAQFDKTNTVGFWVNKDVPMLIGPDGNAYITDGHHTTAGYLAPISPIRQLVAGQNRVILGHIVANLYDPLNVHAPDDSWWTARAAENNAFLYGVDGDVLTLPGEPDYANLQPILPSVLPMPSTPSTLGPGAMLPSLYRGLTWGLADAIVVSATDGSGKKIAGYKKSAPGSSVDINFVEFYWADFLRNRITWDDTKTGSPYGSPNGDASVTRAPLSFFAAVANGIALARSESYRDQYGRRLSDYTNSALFAPNTLNWANGSLSNGLAAANNTYHLYLRDDSTIAGDITPSAVANNILHIDTESILVIPNTVQNIRTLLVNAGAILQTSWKDATVSNSTLRFPAGTGTVTLTGNASVANNTTISNGVLLINGTLGTGTVTVAQGTLGGTGTINGPVVVLANGILAPGASIGSLTVHGALTLNGTAALEANKSGSGFSSDLVTGVTTLTYGGTLSFTASGDTLAQGDSIKLFDAATYRGAFAAFNLPTLGGGLAWDTSQLTVDGTLRVAAAATPTLAISTSPASLTVDVGGTATLIGGAGGTLPITYQWRFNGTDILGQTGPSLVLSSVQESAQGPYDFVASNAAGSVTSQVAIVTVNQAPTAQAQSRSLPWNSAINLTLGGSDPDGDTLTFTVTTQPTHGTLTGSAPALTYTPAAGYTGPDSLVFRVSDGRLTASATVSITVQPGFTYQDTDLLLIFRKDGASDVTFNLGSVSNYLGQANGTVSPVGNIDVGLLHTVFGADLTGVKYVLAATTPVATDGSPLRVWLSDADPSGNPRDETFSRWSTQRGKIAAIGAAAPAYPNSSNQSLVLPANDPGSYTFIAGDGGLQDVTTLGGTSPFPVEIDTPGNARLIELRVSTANPKPFSTQVGNFTLTVNGTLTFTAGILPPVITAGPASLTAPCGGAVTFSVIAVGVNPLIYQWRHAGVDIGGATGSTLTLDPVSAGDAGLYKVVVGNAGGSVSSADAVLTVIDAAPPQLSIARVGPSQIQVTWPQSCVNYTLQETHGLPSPPEAWTAVSGVASGGQGWQVMVPVTTNTFYRLRSP
jgi:hypothetical protein